MIAWLGTITSIIGSFLVAFGVASFGYAAFTIGALSWLYVAALRKDKPLFFLNAVFLTANLIGLYRNF